MNTQAQTKKAAITNKPAVKKYTREECLALIAAGEYKMDLIRLHHSQNTWTCERIENILVAKDHTDILMFLYFEETKVEPTPYTPALKNKYFTNQVELFLKKLKEIWTVEKERQRILKEKEDIQKRIAGRNAALPETTAELAKRLGISKAALRAAKTNGSLQKDQQGQFKIVA